MNKQQSPKIVIWILWFALFNSQFIFLGVAHFALFKSLPQDAISNIHFSFFAIAILMAFVSEKFYRSAVITSAEATNPAKSAKDADILMQKAFTSYILSWALGESITILGLVLPMIGGAGYVQYGYGLMATGICLQFYRMPKIKS